MKIARIELFHVAIPLPAPFEPAWIPGMRQRENRFDLIRLTTSSGIEGYGAAPAMGAERAGFGALLGPYFLGERADDITNVRQRIREMGYLGFHAGWIEPACWDIIGKARQQPLFRLLGGRTTTLQLYASTGDVKSNAARIDEVGQRLSEGFSAVKLRVHEHAADKDLEHIRATRKACGDELILAVDANQGWRVAVVADAPKWDYERALTFCHAAHELGYQWVEEPLPMDSYHELRRLTAATEVAIAGGELNKHGLPEFKTMLEHRCYDWYQPDATFTGGVAETWAIIQHVTAAGATYTPHTWTNGIGFAVNMQLFAASPTAASHRLEYPYSPPGWVPEARDGLLTEPWYHEGGKLRLPDRPGLGFEIDPAALRRYGSRFFIATPARVALRAVRDRGLREAQQLGKVRGKRLRERHEQLEAQIAKGQDPLQLALGQIAPPRTQQSAAEQSPPE